MYQPKYFRIEELLPQRFFELNEKRGSQLWVVFDDRALITLYRIRERYKRKVTINTWLWNDINPFNFRGYRPPDCEVGAPLSQHRFGRAFDLDVDGIPAHEIRADIRRKDKTDNTFEYITAVEDNITWLHFDVRNWQKEIYGINFFNPK